MTELFPGCLHLLVHAGPTGVPAPSGAAPAGDCYQLLLGVRKHLSPRLGRALIGRAEAGPLAGLTVYDALQDPRSAQLLLERLRRPGTAGPLRFEGDPSVQVPAGLAPRLLEAEQSNSSLVYGDAFILKVFRRIQPGVNPDLEVPVALAGQGCGRVPAPVAWFRTTHPQEATLGVLQPFLPDASDGWALALQRARRRRRLHRAGPRAGAGHRATCTSRWPRPSPPAAHGESGAHGGGDGRAPGLRRALRAGAAPLRAGAADRLRRAGRPAIAGPPAQRIHGDLHLGQVLRAGRDWFVIDFEGEPSRPLAERRSAQSPVRDIAGMLRSFDYAARQRRPWRPEWARRCREAFCAGYAARAGWDPRKKHGLLRAYETDRAVYEVLYEARHRPDWLPVPMAAIERLAVRGG